MPDAHPYIIVGLGNPGDEYAHTRHNAGRLVLEMIARAAGRNLMELGKHNAHVADMAIGDVSVRIVLPNTYMNKSGSSVRTFIPTVEDADRLIVVYDELDLPWGSLRIAYGRGTGGHNGVESIIKSIGTKDFVRLRIGVAPIDDAGMIRKPRGEDAVLKFIMGEFTKREREGMKELSRRVEEALALILTKGRQVASNSVNAS